MMGQSPHRFPLIGPLPRLPNAIQNVVVFGRTPEVWHANTRMIQCESISRLGMQGRRTRLERPRWWETPKLQSGCAPIRPH